MKNCPNQCTWLFLTYPNLQKLKKCNNSMKREYFIIWRLYLPIICSVKILLKWNNYLFQIVIKLSHFFSNKSVVPHTLLNIYADVSWPFKTIIWSMHFLFMSKRDLIFGNIAMVSRIYPCLFKLCKYKINICYNKIFPHFLWTGGLENDLIRYRIVWATVHLKSQQCSNIFWMKCIYIILYVSTDF